MVSIIIQLARLYAANSVSLVSVQGSQAFWARHGFEPTSQDQEALASYGSGAVHMILAGCNLLPRTVSEATPARIRSLYCDEDVAAQSAALAMLAEAFAADPSTGSLFYVGHDNETGQDGTVKPAVPTRWYTFWYLLIQDTLRAAPPGQRVLYLANNGEAAAVCTEYEPLAGLDGMSSGPPSPASPCSLPSFSSCSSFSSSGPDSPTTSGPTQQQPEEPIRWDTAPYSKLLTRAGHQCFHKCHSPAGLW
jgi:hypothetical protein